MMISAPFVYWWTGTAVISSSVEDIIFWLGPYMASGMVFVGFTAENTVFPIMTDVTQLLSSFAIVRTVATALVKPWGHPFKVTAKGVSTEGTTVQWGLLAPFAFMAMGTALGMLVNVSSYSPLNGTPGYTVNVFWSLFNVAVLCIACAVCVEPPKRRRDERFQSGEQALTDFPGSALTGSCVVLEISLSGARLTREGGWSGVPPYGRLTLDGGALQVPFSVIRVGRPSELSICFELDQRVRREFIRKLFTGGYDNEVEKVRPARTMANAIARVFS